MHKKQKTVKIPDNRIDFGIRASLNNSKRINKLASKVFKNDPYLGIVFYYYALEEYGKAIYLEDSKKDSQNGFINIKLADHKLKWDYVEKYHAALIPKKLKFIQKWVKKNHHPLIKEESFGYYKETRENIFRTAFERTSFWLVDYDQKTERWNEYRNIEFDNEKLKNNISKLYVQIRKTLKNYKR